MVCVPLGFPALDFRAEPPLRAGGAWIVCVGFWLPVHLPCSVPSCAVTSIPWTCFRQFGEQREGQPLCTAGVCRATDTSVKQLWCRAMEQPQGDATFQDSVADMAPEYPRREKTLGCLGRALHCTALPMGPVGSLSQAEARKWECSESKALLLFVCFSSSLLWQSLAQKLICISAATADVGAEFVGTL